VLQLLARILAGAGRPAGPAPAPPLARLREDTQALVPIRAGFQAITLTGATAPEPTDSGAADHVAEVILAAISALDTEMVERNRMARLARIAGSHATRFPTRQGQ
jgi:hypothetical protein